MPKKIVSTSDAPRAVGPYSQAVRAGGFLFISGQVGIDPATGTLVPGGFEAEAEQVLSNLQAILAAEGLSPGHLVKTTVFLADLQNFPRLNEIYRDFAGDSPPARSTIQATALPLDAQIEIEAVALAD